MDCKLRWLERCIRPEKSASYARNTFADCPSDINAILELTARLETALTEIGLASQHDDINVDHLGRERTKLEMQIAEDVKPHVSAR